MTDNNKFVPQAPKTYEVRYVENKEHSNLSKLPSYLGIKTVECSGKKLVSQAKVYSMLPPDTGGGTYDPRDEGKSIRCVIL